MNVAWERSRISSLQAKIRIAITTALYIYAKYQLQYFLPSAAITVGYQQSSIENVRSEADLRPLIIFGRHIYLKKYSAWSPQRGVAEGNEKFDSPWWHDAAITKDDVVTLSSMPAATPQQGTTLENLKEGYGLMFWVVGAIVIVHIVALVRQFLILLNIAIISIIILCQSGSSPLAFLLNLISFNNPVPPLSVMNNIGYFFFSFFLQIYWVSRVMREIDDNKRKLQ